MSELWVIAFLGVMCDFEAMLMRILICRVKLANDVTYRRLVV